MNTKQRILGIRLSDKLRQHPGYARSIGVDVINGSSKTGGGFKHGSPCSDRR